MSSNNVARTSDGLRDLLIRHGVKPTMNRCEDIKLAKKFMPASYENQTQEGREMTELYQSNKLFNLHDELMKERIKDEATPKTKKNKQAKKNKRKKAKTLEDVKLLRLDDVINIVHYGKPSIYRLISEGRFPKPIKLGGRSVFWVQSEIIEFMQEWINQPR